MAFEHTSRIRSFESKGGPTAHVLLECGHRVTLSVPPNRMLGDVVECPGCRGRTARLEGLTMPDGFRERFLDRSPLGEMLERTLQRPPMLGELVDSVLAFITAIESSPGSMAREGATRSILFKFAHLVQELGVPRDLSAESLRDAYRDLIARPAYDHLRLTLADGGQTVPDRTPTAEEHRDRRSKFVLRTKDAPTAGGRTPRPGEREWCFVFPLDDGRQLYLEVGVEGRAILERVMLAEMLENGRGGPDSTEDGRK